MVKRISKPPKKAGLLSRNQNAAFRDSRKGLYFGDVSLDEFANDLLKIGLSERFAN